MALKVYYIKWLLLIRDRFTPRPLVLGAPNQASRRYSSGLETVCQIADSCSLDECHLIAMHYSWKGYENSKDLTDSSCLNWDNTNPD